MQRSQHDSESEGNESSDDTGADDDDNEEPTVQQRPQNQQNQYIRQTYQQPYQQQIQQTSHMQYGEFTLNGFSKIQESYTELSHAHTSQGTTDRLMDLVSS